MHLVDVKDESTHIVWTQLRNNEFLELLKPHIGVIETKDTISTNIQEDSDIQDDSDIDSERTSFNPKVDVRKSSLHTMGGIGNLRTKNRSWTPQEKYEEELAEGKVAELQDNFYNLKKILNVWDFRTLVKINPKYQTQDFDKTTQFLKKGTVEIVNESYSKKMHNHLEN